MNLTFVGYPTLTQNGRAPYISIHIQGDAVELQGLLKSLARIKDSDDLVAALLQQKPMEERLRLLAESVAERMTD